MSAENSSDFRPPPGGWQTWMICLWLAVLVWIVFGQTLQFEFVNYDDPAYVCDNPAITQGLNWPGAVWIFSHANVGTWFPLTDLSHQLDWQIYGSNAGGHHLTNVLLHTATTITLFLALRRLTGRLWRAAFVAAVFAIHPLRAESVAWVAERKDVLSGFFFMLTLWTWAGYAQKKTQFEKQKWSAGNETIQLNGCDWRLDYGLALLFFALGLLSKSMLVTLPFVLLLLDYWPLNRAADETWRLRLRAWRGLVLEKTPFLLLATAISIVTIRTQKNAVAMAHGLTFFGRVGNALSAYVDYLGHMIYPVGLAVAYRHSETNPSASTVGWAVFVLAGITIGVVIEGRRHPYLLVGWLWYAGMLLPVIDIMQAAQNFRADRYTYLPQIGLCVLITWSLSELSAKWRQGRFLLGCAAAAALTCLLLAAHSQTASWKNSVSLWTRAVACAPANAFAENNLGGAFAAQSKWNIASQHYQRALQLESDYPEAEVNFGISLINEQQTNSAIPHFLRALELNPYSADAHYNLGNALAAENRTVEAIAHYEQAIACRPDFAGAHYDLGLALATQGRWAEAIPHYEAALHVSLDETGARYLSAGILANQKKWAEAIELYQQVLRAQPNFSDAENKLGIALAAQGKTAAALEHFQQALNLANTQGDTALAQTIRARMSSNSPAPPLTPRP